MKIGDSVIYVDKGGREHNALVIRVWQTCFNIVYVEPNSETPGTNSEGDSFGNRRIKETSIPFYEVGMEGFYIKKILDRYEILPR